MQASKVLMLIGSALVSSRLGRSVSGIELDDVLGILGVTRRRSHLVESLALVGVGVAVGAGAALLLAPASGSETRKRLSQSVERLGQQAAEKLEQVQHGSPTQGSEGNSGPSARGFDT